MTVRSRTPTALRTALGAITAFGTALAIVVVLGLALQPSFADNGPTALDAHVTRWFVEHRTSVLTAVMRAMTWLGSSAVIVPITVVGVGVLLTRHRGRSAAYLAVAVAGASLLSTLAKHVIGRDRPPVPVRLAHVVSSSFPSGHATQATATYAALAVVACVSIQERRARAAIWGAAIVAVALVGVSRVYLGVHWATDVVGGWILGACWTAGLTTAFRPLGPDGRTGSSDSFDPGGATRRSA